MKLQILYAYIGNKFSPNPSAVAKSGAGYIGTKKWENSLKEHLAGNLKIMSQFIKITTFEFF